MNTSISETDALAPVTLKRFLSWTGAQTVAYWIFTLIVAFEMIAGGSWNFRRIEYVRAVLAHLGYPMYLLTILGIWKISGGLVLLVPRFPRLKEWAYAGAFFTFSGAFASHLAAGDGVVLCLPPLVFAVVTLASWALLPASRRFAFAANAEKIEPGAIAWTVPILIAAMFLIISFLISPQATPALANL